MVKGEAVDIGMVAVQAVPLEPVVHESQTGPLSPARSAATLCMSCIAGTIVGYGFPVRSTMPKSKFSWSPTRPLAGSSTYWNQSSPTRAGVSS